MNYKTNIYVAADKLGWNVDITEDDVTFQKYSTYGQDFNMTVQLAETFDEFVHNLYEYYDSFDVSTEAYAWLDSEGHGTNGAPYDMKDVYEDFAEIKDDILELWRTLYYQD